MGEYQIGMEFEEYEKNNILSKFSKKIHFNFKRHLLSPPCSYFLN